MKGKDLLEAGYKRIDAKGNNFLKNDYCIALWQKRVDDENGTRYFINFFEYDMSNLKGVAPGLSYDCEVQFHRGENDEQTLSSHIALGKDATVAEYEAFIEELFLTMGFNHYDATTYGLKNRPVEPYKSLQMAAEYARNEIASWLTKNGTYDGAAADVGDLPVEAADIIAKHVKAMQEELGLKLGNEASAVKFG
ncbi:hypothetical protein [Mesorhizobium sp. SP-1A]|uniref:hypothetical protein n=1 Tax=Mesorhizobium sp. SP-1A TaxID=3077840 RepID=UPI0028F74D7E|nr:hypothetical protein [Mesorhizobium sp. SP-1A]